MEPWRLITDDGVDVAPGMATDEALMSAYGRGAQPPPHTRTLRLYTFDPLCALVGRFQSLYDEVDVVACRRLGIAVARRPTGGGAIVMGPGQLGVAVTGPAPVDASPRELLRRYADGIIAGLARVGVYAAFRAKNDLEVDGRKIAGLGLCLDEHGALLFHASVLADLDVPAMLRVLRIPGAKLSAHAVTRVGERVTTVRRETGRPIDGAGLRAAIAAGFADVLDCELIPGELSDDECARRDALVGERYANDAWTAQRSPQRDANGTALLRTPAGLVRIYVGVHGATIKSVLVAGDFNLLPPGLAALEARLRWRPATPELIGDIVDRTRAADGLGVGGAAVAAAVWEATERALERSDAHPVRPHGSCYVPDPEPAEARP